MNKIYKPSPIDTSDIDFPTELIPLSEDLARNVHDVWAEGRLKDGWTYGKTRDDALKTHPCIVSFDDLPESEKDYDRRTSEETLKAIIKLGFKIVRPKNTK